MKYKIINGKSNFIFKRFKPLNKETYIIYTFDRAVYIIKYISMLNRSCEKPTLQLWLWQTIEIFNFSPLFTFKFSHVMSKKLFLKHLERYLQINFKVMNSITKSLRKNRHLTQQFRKEIGLLHPYFVQILMFFNIKKRPTKAQ